MRRRRARYGIRTPRHPASPLAMRQPTESTPGFGLLAQTRIPTSQRALLQRNIILSHSTGVGPLLDDAIVRLILVLKLASLSRGFSGVSEPAGALSRAAHQRRAISLRAGARLRRRLRRPGAARSLVLAHSRARHHPLAGRDPACGRVSGARRASRRSSWARKRGWPFSTAPRCRPPWRSRACSSSRRCSPPRW